MSKEQRKFERMLAAGNKDASEGYARVIGHYEYDFKAGKEKFTPSNSEEVEQPMKEPLVFPFSFVEWYSGMSAEKIERAWKRYQREQGYTLTKK